MQEKQQKPKGYLARMWAESIINDPDADTKSDAYAAAEFIIANSATPTMDDVIWDDKKHYLAGATKSDGTDVVMLIKNFGGDISVLDVDTMDQKFAIKLTQRETLTPNGKRYQIQEVAASEENQNAGQNTHADSTHPKILRSVADLDTAPECTIIAHPDSIPYMKRGDKKWVGLGLYRAYTSDGFIEDTAMPIQVLRWGPGY